MSISRNIEKLRRIDYLISRRSTGSPYEFARKLGIKKSTLYYYLREIRELGIGISYSIRSRTYYYSEGKRLTVKVEDLENEGSHV